ncbi:hypothetical protein Avbf_14948 [Armadillidium vulgare]|nr:hypothetical protein Avbf_14948 [Armadillidium vulgare]
MKIIFVDGEPKLTAEELTELLCSDLQEASTKSTSKREGRSLHRRYCAGFCLDFHGWCRNLCTLLVEEEGSNVLVILPCVTACTMHLASCCFT